MDYDLRFLWKSVEGSRSGFSRAVVHFLGFDVQNTIIAPVTDHSSISDQSEVLVKAKELGVVHAEVPCKAL